MSSRDVSPVVEHPSTGAYSPLLRSRRGVLAAALGGLIGSVATALGRPLPADAGAGDSLKLGQSNFSGSAATRLSATSSGGAFWMTQNGSGSGVRGDSTGGHGGVFTTGHADRYAVYAQQTAPDGLGAAVYAAGGSNIGLIAEALNIYAIKAVSTNSNGIWARSANDVAIYATSDLSRAVQGDGNGASGVGVFGNANGEFGEAVHGQSDGSAGHGAVGVVTALSSSASAVWGYAPQLVAYAGYFTGQVFATDGISSGTAFSTRIDHPLDPTGRYLRHFGVTSDQASNQYSGTVELDASGTATVDLPKWFEAVNADVRYQLTPIGAAMPSLHVASTVKSGRFRIAGGSAAGRVSWLLIGVRSDPDATRRLPPVEQVKPAGEHGLYQSPELYGQPASAGVERHRERSLHLTKQALASSR